MEARSLAAYCNVAEVTFVEAGNDPQTSRKGFWFSDRKYRLVFKTEDEIYERLDRRKRTLFTAGGMAKAVPPATAVLA